MEEVPMIKEEKNFLIGMFIMNIVIIAALIYGLVFFLPLTIKRFDFELMFQNKNVFLLCSFPVIISGMLAWIIPDVIKVYKDIAAGKVIEGIGIITDQGITGYNVYDKYIRIDSFGKKKIKIKRPGFPYGMKDTKIKFRISPKSTLLMGFQKL